MEWYSAQLVFVELRSGCRETGEMKRSLVVFSADSPAEAHHKALDLGRSRERIVRQEDGVYIRRALVRLETLDRVGSEINGKEVLAQDCPPNPSLAFDAVFHPEDKPPVQTLGRL